MSRSTSSWAVMGFLMVLGGCDGPPEIINAMPPGALPPAPAAEKDPMKGPQALGETVVRRKQGQKTVETAAIPLAEATAKGEVKETASKVKYETLQAGKGMLAKSGSKVKVLYKGTLENGEVFDSTHKEGKDVPFEFTPGVSGVIKGWHEGIVGMRVGERRKLTIPPEAAYGADGSPPKIGPNATLTFEVELLSVE
jgi:FKBP-type peptidyl-prolyl cis-trans isomerase